MVARALRDAPEVVKAVFRGLGWGREDRERYKEARAKAFPPAELGGRADPETLRFDYARDYEGDGPVEWWEDQRRLLLRFLRQAAPEGVPTLVAELERLRERATVQLALAERDFQRRWAGLPQEERERLARDAEAEA